MTQHHRWLNKMALFCAELQEFLADVPPDAKLASYAAISEHMAARYPHLAEACDASKTQYMPGIDSKECMEDLEAVYALGVQTLSMLNETPVLGVFQGMPDTRVELFFERPLNMCMALGAEHGLCRRAIIQ